MSLTSLPSCQSIKLGNRNPYTNYNAEAAIRKKAMIKIGSNTNV
jgi:hypothetical protein